MVTGYMEQNKTLERPVPLLFLLTYYRAASGLGPTEKWRERPDAVAEPDQLIQNFPGLGWVQDLLQAVVVVLIHSLVQLYALEGFAGMECPVVVFAERWRILAEAEFDWEKGHRCT